MRLLKTSNLELHYFNNARGLEYAILSHTWGDEEVLFEDIKDGNWDRAKKKHGFGKIENSCAAARELGHSWIWIDTCCIDKSSSAELSEAINSMFDWYGQSAVCLAFLEDVDADANGTAPGTRGSNPAKFDKCKWFTRGWTLQELIAPALVMFYDKNWRPIGDRTLLAQAIAARTQIDEGILSRKSYRSRSRGTKEILAVYSVSKRMAWASQRRTTRAEDRAYSLMGLFGVNMPLLYGEGRKAFYRLQEEILKSRNDQSILLGMDLGFFSDNCLATSPDDFSAGYEVQPWHKEEYQMFPRDNGIVLDVLLCPIKCPNRPTRLWKCAILACCLESDILTRPGLVVEESPMGSKQYRLAQNSPCLIEPGETTVYLRGDVAKPYRAERVTIAIEDAVKENIFLFIDKRRSYMDTWLSGYLPALNISLNINGKRYPVDRVVPASPLSHLSMTTRRIEYYAYNLSRTTPVVAPEAHHAGVERDGQFWALFAAIAVYNDASEAFIIMWGVSPKPVETNNNIQGGVSTSQSTLWENTQPFCFVPTWESMTGSAFSLSGWRIRSALYFGKRP